MAAENATPFPIRAQAYRALVSFRDTSGNLITSWSSPASSISKDGGGAASGPTPTEIGTTGMGYIDLTANQMDASHVQVKCTVSNASQTATVIEIVPLCAEPSGHALGPDIVRFEHLIYNLFQFFMNRSTMDRSGNLVFYQEDGAASAFTGTHNNTGQIAERSKLS